MESLTNSISHIPKNTKKWLYGTFTIACTARRNIILSRKRTCILFKHWWELKLLFTVLLIYTLGEFSTDWILDPHFLNFVLLPHPHVFHATNCCVLWLPYWQLHFKNPEGTNSPGWCGSVDWAPAYKPKNRRFDSQSGYIAGLLARSPVGGHVKGNHTLMFLSSSLSSL